MKAEVRAVLDTIGIILMIGAAVAGAIWVGWTIHWTPDPLAFQRVVAALILGGFLVLVLLFGAFLWIWRMDCYAGRPSSDLHHPLMWSLGAVAVYFGVASISAIDVFYKPNEAWPLFRDPMVRLVTSLLIIAIVVPRGWMLWRILRGERYAREALVVPPDLDDRECGEIPVR